MSSTGTEGAPAGVATPPWFEGHVPTIAENGATKADPAFVGYIQNRGWDKFEPAKAAIAAMQAHQAAEKLIGAPANELLRMPKDAADADGWTRFNERVGVPKDVKEYDFSTIKVGDKPLDAKFIEKLGPALQAAHVNKADAAGVAKAVADVLAETQTISTQDATRALDLEREALNIQWGANREQNLLVAKNTAKTLGVDPDAVSALEKQIGYAKVMEMFRTIGSKIGEDKLILNNAPGGSGFMSQEQAKATLDEKMADKDWVAKFDAGDTQAKKEFHNLTQMISGKAA